MRTCRVHECEQLRPLVDDLFCRKHREKWIIAVRLLNENYDENEKKIWIDMFCEER